MKFCYLQENDATGGNLIKQLGQERQILCLLLLVVPMFYIDTLTFIYTDKIMFVYVA